MTSILVLAAHPDDEVLGCGGTIAKYTAEKVPVHVAFLADGVTSRGFEAADTESYRAELRVRRDAARKCAEILGVSSMYFGDLPDNRLDSVPLLDIVKTVETLIVEYKPTIVLTHHAGDVNVDHCRVHQASVVACRPQPGHSVRTLLSFEVPSSTEWQFAGSAPAFNPNWFVDITQYLEQKLSALDAYARELRAWPHPRSRQAVEHLARWRGAIVGTGAAEAFVLGRKLC